MYRWWRNAIYDIKEYSQMLGMVVIFPFVFVAIFFTKLFQYLCCVYKRSKYTDEDFEAEEEAMKEWEDDL